MKIKVQYNEIKTWFIIQDSLQSTLILIRDLCSSINKNYNTSLNPSSLKLTLDDHDITNDAIINSVLQMNDTCV